MKYIIHGATGAQGSPVVSALTAIEKPVIGLTRNPDAVLDGAQAMAADLSSVAELTEAYRDATGVFVHLPVGPEEQRREYARNIVAAVREARPARVVVSTSGFPLDQAPGERSAIGELVDGLAESGVSAALITPELFLENLLLPPVIEAVVKEGVLSYPLAVDFSVSWASHSDVADVAAALFERSDVDGVVAVGQLPALTGTDLASAFAQRLGRPVSYEAISPEQFGSSLEPLLGAGAAAEVAAGYEATATLPNRSIDPEHSSQRLLDVTPRTPGEWLADVAL